LLLLVGDLFELNSTVCFGTGSGESDEENL